MNWKNAKLGDVVRFLGGGTPSKKNPEYWGGAIPWATVKDIKGPVLENTIDSITEEGLRNSASRIVPSGTVIIPTRMALGKAAITTQPIAINQDLKAAIPTEALDPKYLLQYFLSESEAIERLGAGATVKGVTLDKLARLEIPLPSIDEQKRIAAVLDKADALRRQREESLKLTEKLLQSVFIDMFGDPEAMPQPKLAELLTKPLRNGLSPASAGRHRDTVFTLSAITRGSFNSQARKEAMFASPPRPGARVDAADFLICRGNGNLRLCGKGQFPTADAIGVVFPDTIIAASIDITRVSKPYFETLWNQPFVRRQIESGARTANGIHKVNQTTLEGIKIPLPDFNNQVAFARVAEAIISSVKNLEASADQMANLFFGLQQRAFRGELDLSRLILEEDVEAIERAADKLHHLVHVTMPKTFGSKNPNPAFVAPPEIEQTLKLQDATVQKGSPIPWSLDYFRYRILAAQPAPFSFADLMQKAEAIFEEPPPYEMIRELIFDLLGQDGKPASLRQRFDLLTNEATNEVTGRKEIVFEPVP